LDKICNKNCAVHDLIQSEILVSTFLKSGSIKRIKTSTMKAVLNY